MADPGAKCDACAGYEYAVGDGELPFHNSKPHILQPHFRSQEGREFFWGGRVHSWPRMLPGRTYFDQTATRRNRTYAKGCRNLSRCRGVEFECGKAPELQRYERSKP